MLFITLLFVCAATCATSITDESKYTKYVTNFKLSKQYVVPEGLRGSFYEAFIYCQRMNMKLASIETIIESKAVNTLLKSITKDSDSFWSSGTKLQDKGQWIWLSAGQFITFTNWAPNEPNNLNGTQNCIRVVKYPSPSGFGWDDIWCENELPFISKEMDSFWSSGTKLQDKGQWIWLSAGQFITFTNWAPNEPNNVDGNQNCIRLVKYSSVGWDDQFCNRELPFICEF